MSKHTPGPWVVGRDLVGPASREDDQSYGMIMPVAYIERYDFPDSHNANARLIAAAPELLKALTKCVDLMDNGGTWTIEDQREAIETITKATGDR